jgi:hypothetical protein
MISPAPRSMSRQAGPSIVLSVLIVCFFAVALFQRDSPRVRAKGGRSPARESVARTTPPDSGRKRTAPTKDEARIRRAIATNGLSSKADDSTNNGVDRARSAAPSQQSAAIDARTARSESPGLLGSKQPGERATRAPARGTGRATGAGSAPPQKTVAARDQPSAFTTALESETIEDVSSRVYGTPDYGDMLWRANRDTLPQRNSPVSTGMLLRTPSIR